MARTEGAPEEGCSGPGVESSPDLFSSPRGAPRKTSRLILETFSQFALNKFDYSEGHLEAYSDSLLATIENFVQTGTRVEACLPAFPFKSANKVYKVLGSLPDKAEELALERLDEMCSRIAQLYPPGARVTIISDGVAYNDLLCISDKEAWAYGQALRAMAAQRRFHNVRFARMKDLLEMDLPDDMREITYVANCTNFRHLLMTKFGRHDLDIDQEIATNSDIKLTYLGYKRFLESDLKFVYPQGPDRTSNDYRRDCKYLAKQMLIRGYAFAGAVKNAFPDYLRLSIHESISGAKLSISLLNTRTGFTTPWHCSVALLAGGEWISAPMGQFAKDDRLEIIYENGCPSYFKEKQQGPNVPGILEEGTASYLRSPRGLKARDYLDSVSASTSTGSTGGSSRASPEMTSPSSFDLASPSTATLDGLVESGPSASEHKTADSPVWPYGRRLIPQIMDDVAHHDPERVVFSLTTMHNGSPRFRHISAKTFAEAVDRTAWWLHQQVGKPDEIQPLAYIGPHDLRHILLTYASVKNGCAALYLSPKNNTDGAVAVLEATSCTLWVSPVDVSPIPLVKTLLERRPMQVLKLPTLEDLLDGESARPFPYTKTFDEAINEPFCFLHTSGTTGVPKPIPWSHGLIGTMDAVRLLPPVAGESSLPPWTSDWKSGDTIYSSFPMSHGAGIIMDILMPALFELHCVLGPAEVLPNVNLVEVLAESIQIDIWSMVPSLVDEVGETPEVLEKLRRSKFICASGGPVSPVSAAKANQVVRVLNLTGTTEGLFIGNLVPPREDWYWFHFHPYSGFEFRQVDSDTYEHWVHRKEHWPLFQGIFHTFPDKDSINLKDLYMPHPTKKDFWAFKGRSDDLVVLSNGYKISPLETEAFITTHPAVKGCLIFGTGKPQAGLLIELKDPSNKSDEVLDSIWESVREANSLSRHKNQLLRDFVTFAEPDKPFFRTDKGTIKRPATLSLYADFIERFYGSRDAELTSNVIMDMSSTGSIQAGIRSILLPTIPEVHDIEPSENLFDYGLDSLGAFAAVKSIRAATGLGELLAPRHVYANPTVAGLSDALARIYAEANRVENGSGVENAKTHASKLEALIAQHKARQSFSLNPFDYVNPNHGMGIMLYLPLRDEVSFETAFRNLQEGLNRTFDMIPALGGKMTRRSESEIGYSKGDLSVTIPPLSMAASAHNRLVFKDLSDVLPSFDELRAGGFVPSAFKDDLVLRDDPFPQFPADIFVGQANFVSGGCILAMDLNHCCLDGVGAMVAIRAWAENCRFLQGDRSATCDWYDPESFNHSLPGILHEIEGRTKPLDEVDPATWDFLPFFPPDEVKRGATEQPSSSGITSALPKFPLHQIWPLHCAERRLRTTLFLIKPNKLEAMMQEVRADPEAMGVVTSPSDIVQAFFWRAAVKARYMVATKIRKQTFGPDDGAILELPTDGRPYYSPHLPSTYMGSLLILNRCSMPVETLCSGDTSIGHVARILRQSAGRITTQLVHDAFTILKSLPDHSRFSTANMGLEHMHTMISNMMLFPMKEICFGDSLFAEGGSPETMRPQLERGSGRFRFLAIFPTKKDGGIELVLGTHPEELEMLQMDPEFTRYAELLDTSC